MKRGEICMPIALADSGPHCIAYSGGSVRCGIEEFGRDCVDQRSNDVEGFAWHGAGDLEDHWQVGKGS